MKTHYNVNCMMCGRGSGYVQHGAFYRQAMAPPLAVREGRSRCGFCGGNVYFEAEDSPVLPQPVSVIAARQARRAS